MSADELKLIERLLAAGETTRAAEECRRLLSIGGSVDDASFWFLYGKVLWKGSRHVEAESAFRRAVDIDGESPARIALEHCEDISSFFNPDMLNP